MRKNILFNAFVLFIGALSGINCFLFMMWFLYRSDLHKMGIKLLPHFIFILLLFIVIFGILYSIIIFILKSIGNYGFVSQTMCFILATFVLLFLFPIVAGLGSINPFYFFTHLDGILTAVAIFYSNLICSYGIWVSESHQSKKLFFIISAFILLTSAILF